MGREDGFGKRGKGLADGVDRIAYGIVHGGFGEATRKKVVTERVEGRGTVGASRASERGGKEGKAELALKRSSEDVVRHTGIGMATGKGGQWDACEGREERREGRFEGKRRSDGMVEKEDALPAVVDFALKVVKIAVGGEGGKRRGGQVGVEVVVEGKEGRAKILVEEEEAGGVTRTVPRRERPGVDFGEGQGVSQDGDAPSGISEGTSEGHQEGGDGSVGVIAEANTANGDRGVSKQPR